MDSILDSVKDKLDIEVEGYDAFDETLIDHINSVLMICFQLGVGPSTPFTITGRDETWSDFFAGCKNKGLAAVKSYMFLKVKLLFDPPDSGVLYEAMERQVAEYEWRLNVQAETPEYGVEVYTNADEDGS